MKIGVVLSLLLPITLASSCGHGSTMPGPTAKDCQGVGASDVVLLIKRFDVPNAEIPVVYDYCPNSALHLKFDPVHGTASFDGDDVTLRFRLDSSLVVTQWNANDKTDSVRMRRYFDDNNIPKPDRTDWCGSTKPPIQVVNREMYFHLCTDDGTQHKYEYELHLNQTATDANGQSATIDVAIDPQIIHHPTVLSGSQ
jgi:hypothetical protein